MSLHSFPRGVAAEPEYVFESLTARERDVLALAATGMTSREIASQLAVSTRTIDFHLSAVYRKLGVTTRLSAIALAMQRGLLVI